MHFSVLNKCIFVLSNHIIGKSDLSFDLVFFVTLGFYKSARSKCCAATYICRLVFISLYWSARSTYVVLPHRFVDQSLVFNLQSCHIDLQIRLQSLVLPHRFLDQSLVFSLQCCHIDLLISLQSLVLPHKFVDQYLVFSLQSCHIDLQISLQSLVLPHRIVDQSLVFSLQFCYIDLQIRKFSNPIQ